jgi:hypothetical protein
MFSDHLDSSVHIIKFGENGEVLMVAVKKYSYQAFKFEAWIISMYLFQRKLF